jgi:hypothetical protein
VFIFPLAGEKKKRLRFTPISVRFGETEAASDFGSVCLAEAKSEVHTEAHSYPWMTILCFPKICPTADRFPLLQ